MALRIELWRNGVLQGGVENWWDGVERALGLSDEDFPLLARISPYGDTTMSSADLSALAKEARGLALYADASTRELLLKLSELCEEALGLKAELRFNGD